MATSDDEHRSGLTDAAGRAALYPARAAARVWRSQLEEVADEMLSAPEIARVIDRALAGPLPEEIAQSLVRHSVIERIVAELARSGELERMITGGLGSPQALELTDKILASEEMQLALGRVASSPELRDAVARQTSGLAEEVVGGVRASAVRLDDRAEEVVRRKPRTEPSRYGGIGTRAIALATDVGLTLVMVMALTGFLALITSLVGDIRPEWFAALLLSIGGTVVTGAYFVLFWSAAGQTPGMRLMRLTVHDPGGSSPSFFRSIVRFVGLLLSIVPLFAGFLPILFTKRRRGLADYLAGTVVLYDRTRG